MREPDFWYRPPSLLSSLLTPLGALYGMVTGRRMGRAGFAAGVPVICVGNYHVGGAGKTPMVLVLANLLRELAESPVVLSRGYGGQLRGPLLVDPARHEASDVGDEPLMLARSVPVVVARDRIDGVALAKSQNASVIVMDDGFQNPAIAKDGSLIVIDSDRGLGNGKILPAGPLRAPLPLQIARTDGLIVIGGGSAAEPVAAALAGQGRMVVSAHLRPEAAAVASLQGKRVLAFAGIGDPKRFFRTLRGCDIEVVSERAFPDHHPFSEQEIAGLIADASRHSLTLVTTEKDMVRLRNAPAAKQVVPFPVTLELDEPSPLAQVRGRFVVSHTRPQIPCGQLTLLFQRGREMPLQNRVWQSIGFLQIDAPVLQLVKRYPRVGHCAPDVRARRDHAEIAVQILHLRLAMPRGREFVQHGCSASPGRQGRPDSFPEISIYHQ